MNYMVTVGDNWDNLLLDGCSSHPALLQSDWLIMDG